MSKLEQSTIHQEVLFNATPAQVYAALMESDRHAAFTGRPAQISGEVGGAFTAHEGYISGRNIELIPGTRIVQSWRGQDWEPGIHSIIRFELKPEGTKTKVIFDHAGYPDGAGEHLTGGWQKMYWEPMQKYFAK